MVFDFRIIGKTKKELAKYQAEVTKEMDNIKKHTRNLLNSWSGDSAAAFEDASDIINKNLFTMIYEFNDLLTRLDYAVEAKKETEERLKIKIEETKIWRASV